jgi:hypothetical protein
MAFAPHSMMRRYLVSMPLALALAVPAHAQGVLDRIVGQTNNGAPLSLNGLGEHTIGALAFAARVPIGVELAGPAIAQQHIIMATGTKLGVVLDAIVAADPRYEWREDAGVIVIRPRQSWIEGNPILDLPVAGIQRKEMQAIDGVLLLRQLFEQRGAANGLDDPKHFSIDLPPGRLFDVLNGIARAHGSLAWMLQPPNRRQRSPAYVYLITNRSGVGVSVPVSILQQPHVLGLGLTARQAWPGNDSRPLLDRIVGSTRDGEPLILTGIAFLPALADAVGVPMGQQLVPPTDPAVIGLSMSVAATGLPLGTVLAAIVAQDPRYAWREMDGVIVFRPKAAWDNADDPLSEGIDAVRLNSVPIDEAIGVVLRAFASPAERPDIADRRRITVHLPPGTRLELLNAIVKAHGELSWEWRELPIPIPSFPELKHSIGFQLFGGGGFGFIAP